MTKPNGNKFREDRISKLSDDAISQIMSRMPMKYAVRTTTLSRRWKYAYASTYDIDIDDMYVDGLKDVNKMEMSVSSFRSFVDMLLASRVSRIRSFRSIFRGSEHFPEDLSRWIPEILSRDVQNLEIEAFSIQSIALPGTLSSCGSLTTLRLILNGSLRFPDKNCFPNLKSLLIRGKHGVIPIYNEQSARGTETSKLLLFNFPVLEVFELRNCRFMNVDSVEINVPQLITCTLDCAFSFRHYNEYEIKIVGPQLVEFNSYHGCLDNFVMCTPKLCYAALENRFFDNETLGHRANAFLNRVPSLEGLKLSSEIAEVLVKQRKHGHDTSIFNRLKQLELRWHPKELLELLGEMPCLESLKLNMSYQYQYENDEPPPPFILQCLKKVELIDFRGENTQMELAKMFLENARRLERVVVCLGEKPFRSKDEITRLLQTFERMNSRCSIVVT